MTHYWSTVFSGTPRMCPRHDPGGLMAPHELIDRELFAALNAGNIATALTCLPEAVAFRFGSAEASVGRAAMASTPATMFGVVASMSHKMLAVWTTGQPDPAVICE